MYTYTHEAMDESYTLPQSVIDASPAQYQQDLWVLQKTKMTPGFYLEIGCGDGILLNNTYLLEQHGWKGISVDPFPMDWSRRTNPLVKTAIWDKACVTRFVRGAYLGGIEECLGKWKTSDNLKNAEVVELTTFPIRDFLASYKVPQTIDYLSIDTEGSEHDILAAFPFDSHSIRLITVEHNHEEPKRTMIKELLGRHGYVLDKSEDVEDFYVLARK